jgi:hypothetical protein
MSLVHIVLGGGIFFLGGINMWKHGPKIYRRFRGSPVPTTDVEMNLMEITTTMDPVVYIDLQVTAP